MKPVCTEGSCVAPLCATDKAWPAAKALRREAASSES